MTFNAFLTEIHDFLFSVAVENYIRGLDKRGGGGENTLLKIKVWKACLPLLLT